MSRFDIYRHDLAGLLSELLILRRRFLKSHCIDAKALEDGEQDVHLLDPNLTILCFGPQNDYTLSKFLDCLQSIYALTGEFLYNLEDFTASCDLDIREASSSYPRPQR